MQQLTAPSHSPHIPAHKNGNQLYIQDTPFLPRIFLTMGHPFTIAVSVAGLTSLGIQLAQGLKKYADSALDSKGRILAISTDIELAVQVIRTLRCKTLPAECP
jgi:hypothetical protein